MVCSIGSVKMTVMARILASGSFQQAVTAEKAGYQKLVGQYIQKALLDADDPNLIDEEDMHVFDLNPLADHLHLVCCNSCKKPVKASQFVVHAERCSSLGFAEELFPDLDNGAGNRKPPRKGRKKIVTAGNHVTSTGLQKRYAIVDASETAASTSQMDDTAGHTSSCFVVAKDTPVKISGSMGEMIPLTKRPKLVAATTAQSSEDMRPAPDIPAPLAAKTYYSQRNNRLRAAISFMYHQKSTGECPAEEREPQGNLVTWEPLTKVSSDEQSDDCSKKAQKHFSSPSTQSAGQFTQSPAGTLINTGSQPSNSSMDQSLMTDAYTPQVASLGEVTPKYHSKPYSLTGNSDGQLTGSDFVGQPMRRIQQPNGSVPAV
uniref:SAGA-associated factor 11 n=2 Tax=Opuntia streptacantha TaxID=393608 RepID=A0A7C9AAN1_OPUST